MERFAAFAAVYQRRFDIAYATLVLQLLIDIDFRPTSVDTTCLKLISILQTRDGCRR